MATFKANGFEFNPKYTDSDNLRMLIEAHNSFVSNVTQVINNLDDENLSETIINKINGKDSE